MGTKTVEPRIAALRERRQRLPDAPQRATVALAGMVSLWQSRLDNAWTPPPGSPFPWAMVRRSLAALIASSNRCIPTLTPRAPDPGPWTPVLALILAGNTPLLAWPALTAALAAGIPLFIKLSRDETLWTRLFLETLAEIDGDLAALVETEVWPGTDARTDELVRAADMVIAYGSDSTMEILRQKTPDGTPFYGFGHAISVGIALPGSEVRHSPEGFAYDTLMYGQQGCLSPQAIFVEGTAADARAFTEALEEGMKTAAEALEIPPVSDPAVALAVRTARDMGAFSPGTIVRGDAALRWTIIACRDTVPLREPTGHGVLTVIPVQNLVEEFGTILGSMRGKVSAVGYNGVMTPQLEMVLRRERITYLCPAGQMQTPPLDWPNGNIDLFAEMRHRASQAV